MDISEMTEQEKSYYLARAMDWHIANLPLRDGHYKRVIVDADGKDLGLMPVGGGVAPVEVEFGPRKSFNLYDPANMALAWRALNWAIGSGAAVEKGPGPHAVLTLGTAVWGWLQDEAGIFSLPPAEAQAAWLDKVLELAIAAGQMELIP